MVGPQLGRETDAIAESTYKIKRRLCVTTLHVILKSGRLEKWSGFGGPAKAGPAGPAAPPLYSDSPIFGSSMAHKILSSNPHYPHNLFVQSLHTHSLLFLYAKVLVFKARE